MNKIRYGGILLLLVIGTALSVWAAESGEQSEMDRFPRFMGGVEVVSSQEPLQGLSRREIAVTATLPDYPWVRVSEYRGYLREQCVSCHGGIAEIGASHPRSFGCTVCHGGDGNATDRESAHATLIYDPDAGTGKRNPSSLRVVDKTCGQTYCHSGHPGEDRNHVERVRKSMMSTLAGMISGLRYQWGAQSRREAAYGVRSIEDKDGDVPVAALSKLQALPFFTAGGSGQARKSEVDTQRVSHHIGDRLLRDRCFQCHLDSPGEPGVFRSQGCAACHFTYDADGLYKGGDRMISRSEPGHPALHRMTTLTPDSICMQCHRSYRATRNFAFMEAKPDATAPGESLPVSLSGFGEIQQDVHFAAGFECIDCHTQFDIMGDGNIYSKQHQAVEIRCETCHGNADSRPLIAEVSDPRDRVIRLSRGYAGGENSVGDWMVLSAKQRKLTNVKVREGKIVTLGKRTGRVYQTPLIADASGSHRIPGHKNRLECTACHSQWVPVCKGCHSIFSPSQALTSGAASSGNSWSPAVGTVEIESPSLMIGPRGKVAPMLPQPKRTLSVFDERGNPMVVMGNSGDALGVYREWSFSNPHGYSGGRLAYALNPHSTGSQVRSCASCHLSGRVLGFGEGDLRIGRNSTGKNDTLQPLVRTEIIAGRSSLAPDTRVTVRGEPVAGVSQPGARPFNQKEINRILKVGNCIPCHGRYDDPIYQDMRKSYGFANTLRHHNLRKRILSQK